MRELADEKYISGGEAVWVRVMYAAWWSVSRNDTGGAIETAGPCWQWCMLGQHILWSFIGCVLAGC